MNKLLIPIQYILLTIIIVGSVFTLTDQHTSHAAALAISAGLLLSVIEDYQYGH